MDCKKYKEITIYDLLKRIKKFKGNPLYNKVSTAIGEDLMDFIEDAVDHYMAPIT